MSDELLYEREQQTAGLRVRSKRLTRPQPLFHPSPAYCPPLRKCSSSRLLEYKRLHYPLLLHNQLIYSQKSFHNQPLVKSTNSATRLARAFTTPRACGSEAQPSVPNIGEGIRQTALLTQTQSGTLRQTPTQMFEEMHIAYSSSKNEAKNLINDIQHMIVPCGNAPRAALQS
jgi:hypothetical protein